MGQYLKVNSDTIATKQMLFKHLKKNPVKNHSISGYFILKGFRSYNFHHEVDLEFHGLINVTFDGKKDWYDSSLLNKKTRRGFSVSKIKVNRMIRKSIFPDVKALMRYFNVELSCYNDIKKFKLI